MTTSSQNLDLRLRPSGRITPMCLPGSFLVPPDRYQICTSDEYQGAAGLANLLPQPTVVETCATVDKNGARSKRWTSPKRNSARVHGGNLAACCEDNTGCHPHHLCIKLCGRGWHSEFFARSGDAVHIPFPVNA
jgi:hypothetical protein